MEISADYQVLLVDDDAELCRSMGDMFAKEPQFCVIGKAGSKVEALDMLKEHPVDIVFTDIQMEGGSGFELAEAIHRLYPKIMVVFLTGYAKFALDGYLYGPVDFLVKPVRRERLERTLERIKERLRGDSGKAEPVRIGIPTDAGYRIVETSQIAYLVKEERRVKIVWKDSSCDYTGKAMQELEEILLDYGFFRCHQSCLIPLSDICSIQKELFGRAYKIRLNTAELPLSRKKYYVLKELLGKMGICQMK
ncbi:MAG: response regulator transcription factor [Lachnospiraceae bacterium]|nr:response regulator transcription factor [Lachnospiraceae bacterium]